MSHQINLYSPVFKKRKTPFSAATMAQSAVLVIVALTALGLYARIRVSSVEQQAGMTSQRLKATTQQLAAASKDTTREDRIKALEAKIKESEARLVERKQLIAALDQLTGSRQRGYSEYLRAFARQSVDGVWLTSVTANAEQERLSLTGRALRADLIPTYIDGLRKEPSFKGLGFDRLDIKTVTPAADPKDPAKKAGLPPVVEFQLQSAGFEEPSAEKKP